MAVAECARNVACTGGKPLGLTDCLNFGNPEKPETMWRFARAVDGLAAACRTLSVPVVSGNVSLYNETDGRPILPTPTVAVVGLLEHPDHLLRLGFSRTGAVIAHLGALGAGNLGGSEWLVQRTGRVTGDTPGVDLDAELALQRCVLALAREGLLDSAHDVSDGGIGVCLAEACIQNGLGARLRLPNSDKLTVEGCLFGEEPSRVVVSFARDHEARVAATCDAHGVPFVALGAVGGTSLVIEDLVDVEVADLALAHDSALEEIIGSD
jgi:phosphoribosylformylglycinamidine synthase